MEKNSKEEINSVIDNWSKDFLFEGKPFDDTFAIDSIPLWWFYHRLFVEHVMPKPLNTFPMLYKQQKLSLAQKGELYVKSIVMKKVLYKREIRKWQSFKPKTQKSLQKSVLFLSFTNHITEDGSIFRIHQLVNDIKEKEGLQELVLFADPLSSKTAHKLQGKETIYQYFDKSLLTIAKEDAAKMYQKWRDLPNQQKEKIMFHEKCKIFEYLKPGFDFFISKEFLTLVFLYYHTFRRILKQENVKCILLTATNGILEKCLQAAAFKEKVPTVVVQHGVGGFRFQQHPLSNVHFAVFSERFKERLLRDNVDESNIHVVGPVIFDSIVKYRNKEKKTTNKTTIFFATTTAVEEGYLSKEAYFEIIERKIIEIMNVPNFFLIFKLHPREIYGNVYKELLVKNHVKNAEVVTNQARNEFYEKIASCDVFVNFSSSAAIEAMILNKPVININIFQDITSFTKGSAASFELEKNDDITQCILDAKNADLNNARQKHLHYLIGPVDGKSHERVTDLITKLATKENKVDFISFQDSDQ